MNFSDFMASASDDAPVELLDCKAGGTPEKSGTLSEFLIYPARPDDDWPNNVEISLTFPRPELRRGVKSLGERRFIVRQAGRVGFDGVVLVQWIRWDGEISLSISGVTQADIPLL